MAAAFSATGCQLLCAPLDEILVLLFCRLCHTVRARRSEIVLFFYTQLIRDKKTNQFFLNFISLVLSCSFLTVIGLLRCKCFSGELSRKRFSMVCPGSAVWLPEEGCTQDAVPHLQLREECVNSPPSASASALPPELG